MEELWVSYNQINSLDGLAMCSNLTTLYISNNQIKAWNELDKLVSTFFLFFHSLHPMLLFCLLLFYSCNATLTTTFLFPPLSCLLQAGLPNLRDVLFVGNPIYDDMPKEQARIEVLKRLPQVAKIDGDMVKPTERELATGVAPV